jgi:uncharacterized protein YpmS
MKILHYLSLTSSLFLVCLTISLSASIYVEALKVENATPEFWKIIWYIIIAISYVTLLFIFSAVLDFKKLKSLQKEKELFQEVKNSMIKIKKISTSLEDLANELKSNI